MFKSSEIQTVPVLVAVFVKQTVQGAVFGVSDWIGGDGEQCSEAVA